MAVFGTLTANHPTDRVAVLSLVGQGIPPATLTDTSEVDGLGGWIVNIAPMSTYMDEDSGTVYIFGTSGTWKEI